MSAAKAARTATLPWVFACISLVLALVAACSTAGSVDASDGAGTDAAVQPLTEAECVGRNGDCATATWTNVGTCSIEPKPGNTCGAGDPACTGICSAAGTCVGPGPDIPCGEDSGHCALCDGSGQCVALGVGSPCVPASKPGQCLKATGICSDSATCTQVIDAGAACKVDDAPCNQGICQASGFCARASAGQPCTGAAVLCEKSQGTCDAAGKCIRAADTGAPCQLPYAGCGSGTCSANAVCETSSPGQTCTVKDKQICRKLTGVCGVAGNCISDFDVGAACASDLSPCGGICNQTGGCEAVSVDKPCGFIGGKCPRVCSAKGVCMGVSSDDCIVESGLCGGQPGVCGVSGLCSPTGPCAATVFASTCNSAPSSMCTKPLISFTGGTATCASTAAIVQSNAATCAGTADPCKPQFCKVTDGADGYSCVAGPLMNGTPCPGSADNPCNASICQAGQCKEIYKPTGTPCKPAVAAQCGEFKCSSGGNCVPVPAQVPLPSQCTVADGDTDCWGKSCDSLGNCVPKARIAGEHCGAYPDNQCAQFACDGKGNCLTQLLVDKGNCPDARCTDYNAKPGSPCTGGPCVAGGCSALGVCSTAYLPAGATCTIGDMIGSCDANHLCVMPTKALGAVVGMPCPGAFPCMKEGVSYGADGMCHGTVAAGAACGSLCNPGVCGADGTCKQAYAAKGVVCGSSEACGNLVCDGKGGCAMASEDLGKSCTTAANPPCGKYGCNILGKCVFWPVTGPACTLEGAGPCQTGVCTAGACTPVPKPGGSCGKPTPCMDYSCSTTGQCVGTPKPGASCESTEPCKVGVCDATGQCKQVLAPGTKCVGKQQCMEGICSASGACALTPKAAGSQCTAAAPGNDWSCYTGTCDGKGGCDLKVNTGAKCKKGDGPCTEGICQSDASCKTVPAVPGLACTTPCVPAGKCGANGTCEGPAQVGAACSKTCVKGGKCNAAGQCIGSVTAGESCDANTPTGRCVTAVCKSDGTCSADNFAPAGQMCYVGVSTALSPAAFFCGSPSGKCDGKGQCTPDFTDPDGSPCGIANGCAASHQCKGGLCIPVEPLADGTACTFGCATGVCGAGACRGPPLTPGEPDPGPACKDTDPCTMDFCGGDGLPSYPLNWNFEAIPGKCVHSIYWGCSDEKPPGYVPPCKDSDCGKDSCGYQLFCYFEFNDKIGSCKTKYYSMPFDEENQKRCDDKSPCTLDGCFNGDCEHEPINNGINCAPFKQCQGGKCVPWN